VASSGKGAAAPSGALRAADLIGTSSITKSSWRDISLASGQAWPPLTLRGINAQRHASIVELLKGYFAEGYA
jgi:hypothetical protein